MGLTFPDFVALLFGEVLIIVQILIVAYIGIRGDQVLFWRALLALFITTLVVFAIKLTFPVPRPFLGYQIDLLPGVSTGSTDSFPSAHAAWAFTLAATVWDEKHRVGFIMLTIAVLVATGRVLLFVHSPIDVIVGAILGVVCSLAALFVMKRFNQVQ